MTDDAIMGTMTPKEHILNWLYKIEDDYKIRVLYACESGSRAWGIESPDSDYDVRFLYVSDTVNNYILEKAPETVTVFSEDKVYDFAGWDIRKALRLYSKGNGSILEWLQSPIVYITSPCIDRIRAMTCNRSSTMQSYHGLAKSMGHSAYTSNESVILKKYFYIIRPIAMLQWYIEHPIGTPPITLSLLLDAICISDQLRNAIRDLITRKAQLSEATRDIPKIPIIESWFGTIRGRFEALRDTPTFKTHSVNEIEREKYVNELILEIIFAYSGTF